LVAYASSYLETVLGNFFDFNRVPFPVSRKLPLTLEANNCFGLGDRVGRNRDWPNVSICELETQTVELLTLFLSGKL
jgi:hypothetical protein